MRSSRSVANQEMSRPASTLRFLTAFAPLAVALLFALLAFAHGALASAATSNGKTQLLKMLAQGQKSSSRETVQMGEILGIAAPGSGETIRIHSAWNAAKHVQADAVTILIGRLGANLPSEQVVSTIDVTKGKSTWIKPTTAGAKWTYERLASVKAPPSGLLGDLLKAASRTSVKRLAIKSGSEWRISYTASDLQTLNALKGELGKIPALTKRQHSLLSGEELHVADLQVTLDAKGRITDLKLGGTLTETRADATSRHQPYPKNGIKGVVLLHLAYTYGGSLAITPPPASDVSNPRRPLP
jgi:hypothetical protein